MDEKKMRTNIRNSMKDQILGVAKKIKKDKKRDIRLSDNKCSLCFYDISSYHTNEMANCNECEVEIKADQHVCNSCAKKLGVCKGCGAEMD